MATMNNDTGRHRGLRRAGVLAALVVMALSPEPPRGSRAVRAGRRRRRPAGSSNPEEGMMNHSIRVMRRPWRAWPATARTAAAVIATAALARLTAARRLAMGGLVISALAVTACSSGTASSTVPHAAGSPATTRSQAHVLHLAGQCIRLHGIPNFPDPFVASSGPAKGKAILYKQAFLTVPNSVVTRALAACQTALAQAGISGRTAGPTIPTADQADYLRAAACMRSHGITDFPDPTFSGGHVSFAIPSSIDIHSTQATQARLICEKLIPSGLPDSGSGG
jgi:hypothetical protein